MRLFRNISLFKYKLVSRQHGITLETDLRKVKMLHIFLSLVFTTKSISTNLVHNVQEHAFISFLRKENKLIFISPLDQNLVQNLDTISRKKVRVRLFKKIRDWILKSANGFCISFLNRLIQDLLDHGASKEPKNPLPSFDAQ